MSLLIITHYGTHYPHMYKWCQIFSPVSQGKFNTFAFGRQATEWVAQSAKNDEGSMTMIFLESLKFANVRWTVAAVAWHAVVVALSFPQSTIGTGYDCWAIFGHQWFDPPMSIEPQIAVLYSFVWDWQSWLLAPRCSNHFDEKSQHFT